MPADTAAATALPPTSIDFDKYLAALVKTGDGDKAIQAAVAKDDPLVFPEVADAAAAKAAEAEAKADAAPAATAKKED